MWLVEAFFWKLVNIWWSYECVNVTAYFFMDQLIYIHVCLKAWGGDWANICVDGVVQRERTSEGVGEFLLWHDVGRREEDAGTACSVLRSVVAVSVLHLPIDSTIVWRLPRHTGRCLFCRLYEWACWSFGNRWCLVWSDYCSPLAVAMVNKLS